MSFQTAHLELVEVDLQVCVRVRVAVGSVHLRNTRRSLSDTRDPGNQVVVTDTREPGNQVVVRAARGV